jgi:hypothetical protein
MNESAKFRRSLLLRILSVSALLSGCNGGVEERCMDTLQNVDGADECASADLAQYMLVESCDEELTIEGGPTQNGTECCYDVDVSSGNECPDAVGGRPLRVAGATVMAAPIDDGGWLEPMIAPDLRDLNAEQRKALADMWTEAGLAEHASIASFAKNALDLMALGAPRRLVEEAQRAGLDEVRHASACFTMASAYGAQPIGPGRLPLPDALPITHDLKELAVATALEACLNETLAVIVAGEQREQANDPSVRLALKKIIDDETRHAAFAWLTVRWAIREGGEHVREAVTRALLDAEPHIEAGGIAERDPVLEAHGLLDEASRREAAIRGYREVIRPAIGALLDAHASPRRAV